jgi:hypothetical protein
LRGQPCTESSMSTVLGEIGKGSRFSSPIVLVLVVVLESLFCPARLKYFRFELWVISAPQT